MIAFQNFKEIQKLKRIEDKHRAWLKDYEGLYFSIAKDKDDLVFWQKDKDKYIYSDKLWQGWTIKDFKGNFLYASNINKIQRHKKRIIIEFDGNNAKESFELVYQRLKKENIGFIRSTHNSKNSDYLWVEFTRELTEKEAEKFLFEIAPENSEIDLNFISNKRRFPVLFAEHWKYSKERELPIEYFEGNQIDYDNFEFKDKKKIIRSQTRDYSTAKVFTRLGQAEVFVKQNPLFYDKSCIFWVWNDIKHCYEIQDETDILNRIGNVLNIDTIDSKAKTEIINSLKQIGRLNIPKDIKKTWIQFNDEIFDIKTGERFKATPEYFVTNPIPYSLHQDNFEDTPVMDKIFEEWVGKDYIKTLYEIIAYCLLPDYPLNRLFCFVGSGMNGKSCFLNLLKKFIGIENCTSTELDRLLESRFEVTRLHKKLLCIMGETNFNEIKNTSILKQLTGNDLIGFEYKNKNPFEDVNYSKIIIATNNLPTTSDKSIGFYRRWLVIDFPNQFSEKKNILDDIPEEEFSSLALKSCIILKDLLEKRAFHNEGSIEDRMAKYEAKSNFLEKFVKENTIEDFEGYITKGEFSKNFSAWCKENRHRTLSDNTIANEMKKLNIESGKKFFNWMNDGRGGDARVWFGIKWKE